MKVPHNEAQIIDPKVLWAAERITK